MAYPPLNGILVSSSGVALEERPAALSAANQSDSGGGAMSGIGSLGLGLIISLGVLAYWFRRVL